MIGLTELDRDAMIRTMYGEARGEGKEGLAAVAHVILNRASQPAWWGYDVWSVCHKAMQFSCWNTSDPNMLACVNLSPKAPSYLGFNEIIPTLFVDPDPTNSATHYKVTGTSASWDKATEGVTPVVIGKHSFYKLGPHA